jgi:hypothetical protein
MKDSKHEPQNRGVSIDPNNLPAGLKRMEMTRSAKRDHLADLKIDGGRAKEILDEIYGKEST